MRSEHLLRECVRGILLEKENTPHEEVVLSADDILMALEADPKATHELKGVEIYTPLRQRKQMPSRWRGGALVGLNPFDVVSATKYGSRESERDGRDVTLIATPEAADLVIDTMAERIEYRFRNEPIAAVTCVDSSHGMAAALAKAVAAKLDVPYQPIVKKTMDINLTWDPDEWAAYEQMVRSTGLNGKREPLMVAIKKKRVPATPDEYLDSIKAVFAGELKYARDLIARGEKPTMAGGMNVDTGHKRFFNFFDKVATGDLAPGSKVLVVDDNIDSGWTPYHVAKRVRAAGLEPLFAAGFKMMRYYDKKKPAASILPMMAGLNKKSIDDLGKLADEFAGDLFQVGSLLMAMSDSAEHGVQAAEVFEVLKASPAEVQLQDVDTLGIVRLSGKDLAPEQAHHLWASAA